MTVEDLLKNAFHHHLHGEFQEARILYEIAQRKEPTNRLIFGLRQLLEGFDLWVVRHTMFGALTNLKERGFNPATVFDVGAQVGTLPLYTVFPQATHLLIEPVAENEDVLRALVASLERGHLVQAAAGSADCDGVLSVVMDGRYSSISETGEAREGADARPMPVRRVDSLAREYQTTGPYLIKIDVDGPELAVLEGCAGLLGPDTIFVVEAVVAGEEQPFRKLIHTFDQLGYNAIDILDPLRRPKESSLWQLDLVFAHRESPYLVTTGYFE